MDAGPAPLTPTYAELEAGVAAVRAAPRGRGTLDLIVRRPAKSEREILTAAALDLEQGLVGDVWLATDGTHTRQLTLMATRAIALVAGTRDRWALAGDQLYVDLDLSRANVPPGTRIAIGAAVVEISPEPHTGCRKFRARYGIDAVRFFGSDVGQELQLRGVNAWVVTPGAVRVGDAVVKLPAAGPA